MTGASDKQPSRGRPRSQKSKEATLAAVRELLLTEGYSGLSMEGVAAHAGVSKATIYRWWSSKGELVLEAAQADISIGVVPDTGDAERDIKCAIRQLIDTFSRPLASIVIFAAITTSGSDPKMAQIFRDRYVYPWRKSAAEALARANLPRGRSESDIQFLLDMIVGTVFQRTLVLREPKASNLLNQLTALISGR